MGLYKTRGVVLSIHPVGETSRILDLYTSRFGRIRGIVKGAREKGAREGGSLEAFSYAKFLLWKREGRGLYILAESDLIDPFIRIREDLRKVAYASYMVDVVKGLVGLGEREIRILRLIVVFFKWLSVEGNPISIHAFTLKLLFILGHGPELSLCIKCRQEVDGEGCLSPVEGGLVCVGCAEEGSIRVSKGTVLLMRRLLKGRIDFIRRIRIDNRMEMELNGFLRSYLEHYLPHPLASLKVMDEFEKGGLME
jgi:DNA repair protein RecO (recombination protein O)